MFVCVFVDGGGGGFLNKNKNLKLALQFFTSAFRLSNWFLE